MIARAHWARGTFDQLEAGPLRQFARVREQVPNVLDRGEDDVRRTDFHTTVSLTRYYAVRMAMGKRKRDFSDGGQSPVLHGLNQLLASIESTPLSKPSAPPSRGAGDFCRAIACGKSWSSRMKRGGPSPGNTPAVVAPPTRASACESR